MKRLSRLLRNLEANKNYHINLWENIAGDYYHSMTIHNKYEAKFLRNSEFLIKCDINLKYPIQSYYKITGYSYECRNYVLYMLSKRKFIQDDIFKELDNTYSIISKRCSYRQKLIFKKKILKIFNNYFLKRFASRLYLNALRWD